MTLDEAIKHAEETAEEQQSKADNWTKEWDNGFVNYCNKCAEEHRQLAEWLKELKAYKEQTDEDLISRQAVKDLIRGLTKWGVRSQDGKFENVGLLYDDVMFGIDRLSNTKKTEESGETQ
jgi:hypothetical protein